MNHGFSTLVTLFNENRLIVRKHIYILKKKRSNPLSSDNSEFKFPPKEKILIWNSVDNKTLTLENTAVSTSAKWVKRADLKDVVDSSIVTTVEEGVAKGAF